MAEINKNNLKIIKKTCFCLLLKVGRHAKAGRLPDGYPEIVFFQLIFYFFNIFLPAKTIGTCHNLSAGALQVGIWDNYF